MTKRLLSILLALALALGLAIPALGAEPWYAEAQRYVEENHLADGIPGGFQAMEKVTRAAVVAALYAMEGRPEAAGSTFPDVGEGDWFAPAVGWAQSVGVARGNGAGAFQPMSPVRRDELAALVERYLRHKSVAVTPGSLEGFADADTVAAWAKSGLETCVGRGLLKGDDKGRIRPEGDCTWAELAQVLRRLDGLDSAGVTGKPVKAADKYGSVITDITEAAFLQAGFQLGDLVRITIGDNTILAPFGKDYVNVDYGAALVRIHDGCVEIGVHRGNFAHRYGVGLKEEGKDFVLYPVTIRLELAEQGAYWEELALRDVGDKRTDDRGDYRSDEVFANFREIALGDIKPGTLYRSASAVNPAVGRSAYADALFQKHGIKTVVNMTDCIYKTVAYPGYEGSYYAGTQVVNLNMQSDLDAEEALSDLKNALEFIAEEPGPYAIHCIDGTDWTGYLSMLLEALMGADLRDLVTDAMGSYENLYHVVPDSETWSRIAAGTIEADVLRLTGTEDIFAAGDADLRAAAEEFILHTIGLSEDYLAALKANLSADWTGAS